MVTDLICKNNSDKLCGIGEDWICMQGLLILGTASCKTEILFDVIDIPFNSSLDVIGVISFVSSEWFRDRQADFFRDRYRSMRPHLEEVHGSIPYPVRSYFDLYQKESRNYAGPDILQMPIGKNDRRKERLWEIAFLLF